MTKNIPVELPLIEDAINLLIDITFEHGSKVNVAQMDRVIRGLVEAKKDKRDVMGVTESKRVNPFRYPRFPTVPCL